MCQGSEFIKLKNPCFCGLKTDDRLLSKKELLARLKEHKQNLESEIDKVDKNLESTAIVKEGGD